MTTPKTNTHPEINWTKGPYVESHDHEVHYFAEGVSEDGRTWEATWIVIDGHLEGIDDICESELKQNHD